MRFFSRCTLWLALVVSLPAMGGELAGRVVKVQGDVEIVDAFGKVAGKAAPGATLEKGQALRTLDGMAALRTEQGDIFVVAKNSSVRAETGKADFRHLLGKVLYLFERKRILERNVAVNTAVMGIRGTTFLVEADDQQAWVGLKEGKLEIVSVREGFQLFRGKEQQAFEQFKQEGAAAIAREKQAFELYRNQMREEFVAFKKSFRLNERQSLKLTGNKAVVFALPPDTLHAISEMENFVADLPKKEFE